MQRKNNNRSGFFASPQAWLYLSSTNSSSTSSDKELDETLSYEGDEELTFNELFFTDDALVESEQVEVKNTFNFGRRLIINSSDTEEVVDEKLNEKMIRRKKKLEQAERRIQQIKQQEYKNSQSVVSLLASQVLIGMARDIIWASVACNKDGFQGKIGAFWGATLTQKAASLLPTVAAVRLTARVNHTLFLDNRHDWMKTQAVFALASWSSIIPWNAAQWGSQKACEALGWSATTCGYGSGFFTGITETVWQNAMVIPYLLNQPLDGLEIMLNSLGGAVWQWVYQANLSSMCDDENNLEKMAVAFEVAGLVAFSTLSMTLLAKGIKKHRSQSAQKAVEEDLLEVVIEPVELPVVATESSRLVGQQAGLFQYSEPLIINQQESRERRRLSY